MMSLRKICYVTGTRADFGLMRSTLRLLHSASNIDLSIVVTAMHLSHQYGYTFSEIQAEHFRIANTIPVAIEEANHVSMALAIGHEIIGFTETFEKEKPDIVLLLGDRGEMLAASIAAIHLNIPNVHIHGGERSGTIDEMVRHAISKLSHFHFVATKMSRERLIKMGEYPEHIFVTGAPGLDDITENIKHTKKDLYSHIGFDLNQLTALVVFHPVVQESSSLEEQTVAMMEALLSFPLQLLCLLPNADAGGTIIQEVLKRYQNRKNVNLQIHIERPKYLSWLNAVDVMVGNSSSGIIEAASFGLPVVNIGTRQHARERSDNVLDCESDQTLIVNAVSCALALGKKLYKNIYGDGHAGERMLSLLSDLPLDIDVLRKTNAY